MNLVTYSVNSLIIRAHAGSSLMVQSQFRPAVRHFT